MVWHLWSLGVSGDNADVLSLWDTTDGSTETHCRAVLSLQVVPLWGVSGSSTAYATSLMFCFLQCWDEMASPQHETFFRGDSCVVPFCTAHIEPVRNEHPCSVLLWGQLNLTEAPSSYSPVLTTSCFHEWAGYQFLFPQITKWDMSSTTNCNLEAVHLLLLGLQRKKRLPPFP